MKLHSDRAHATQVAVEDVEGEAVLHLTQRVARDWKDDVHGEAAILVRQFHNVRSEIVRQRVAACDTRCNITLQFSLVQ